MDAFCGSPFWRYNLTWDTPIAPDFTPCFQESVLTWLPCLLLWLLAPIDIVSTYRSQRKYIPLTLFNLSKAFLSSLLCLLSVSELIEALTRNEPESPPVEYVSPLVKSLTYMLVFGLSVFHRKRGIHTSGLVFTFWLLMSAVTLVNFRSIIRSALNEPATLNIAEWQMTKPRFILRIIAAPIVIIQLILACFADKTAHDPFILAGEDLRNRSPEEGASIVSKICFWWLNPLVWLGYKRALTQEDLYPIRNADKTEIVIKDFDRFLAPAIQRAIDERKGATFTPDFNRELSKPLADSNSVENASRKQQARKANTSRHEKSGQGKTANHEDQSAKHVGITCVLLKSFYHALILTSSFKFLVIILTFATPTLLSSIISFISNEEPAWRGVLYALCLLFLSILQSIAENSEMLVTNVTAMRIQTCLTSALYRKSLRLSSKGKRNYTTGQIVNMMSTDITRITDLVLQFNNLWSTPIILSVSMTLLYQQLGVAVFSGLVVMLLNVPFNGWVAYKLRGLQQIVMRFKDKRMRMLSEIFNGIKIIKIHAWEDSFIDRTKDIRAREIKSLNQQAWYSAGVMFTFTSLPFLVALASFTTFILIDPNNILDANKVFVSLALFNIMRFPLGMVPMIINNISMYIVSARRLNNFLESDEIDPDAIKQIDDDSSAIKIKSASFKWDQQADKTLDKIDLSIPKRKLVAIVGPVGSGKSSLLSAILGDLEKCDGEVMVDMNSSMAYVPQEAWVLNTTLKNNIMFNKVVNEERYRRVIDACALAPDLKTLELGDQSEIGEKGLNLSGGQKQRVSLARAVYADKDIYLLDDPLNAVDAHVGKHIFDHIIGPKGMLRNRTRVLVTNKLSVLPDVDHIYVMKDGQISESGSYEQLLKNRGLFSQLLVKYLLENFEGVNLADDLRSDAITEELKRLTEKLERDSVQEDSPAKKRTESTSSKLAETVKDQGGKGANGGNGGNGHDLTGHEVSKVGSVGLEVHLNFIRTMGVNFMIALAIHTLSGAFSLSSDIWLSAWSNDALNVTLSTSTSQRNLRLGIYAGLGISESVCVIMSTILVNIACLNGSKILHNRMLARVLRAPMSWFNTTPSGRIINRFSKDIDTVDVTIRFNVRILMITALRSVIALILISVGSAYSIILLIPTVPLYFLFQLFYVSTSRQLKRIESTTKSPVYSHFSETINGTSSIRAFGVSQEFILESNHRVDTNNASFYLSTVTARWLGMRLSSLGFVVVFTVALIAVLSKGSISPGIAGLTVTYALGLTSTMSHLVRVYSDYEINVVSVERLIEYTKTPVEPEDDGEPSDPNWPARGEIVFKQFSTRYRPELDLVLNKLDLKINSAERVGLVGRTGAGKSSVTLALFRIIEAADGCVVIDDVNISHISLKMLRSKLSIIPQEPIMFTGTIRQNVDPTETYPDGEIWRAIDLAHLGGYLRTLADGLDHEVSEGGSNFSVGQRQLFCLARTLLRRSKILILDEATAAVDVETDTLIQQTIRKEFTDSTILTIAHRLETIQDYDRVVVMENGTLAEQGSPTALMKQSGSKFRGLAREAGLTS